ncbi:MAG: CopG family transcriptional regulator [Chitinispirillia bacterium]|nr:CopG family transcriptional regulator [Chitinispirillia bacterium]MCL2268209.1 CopG family transcriptional regulator [Chitinispirillia bacterium]
MNKNKAEYTAAPPRVSKALEEAVIIEDFLPPPEELVFKRPKVKITMAMNSGTIDILKTYAKKHNVKYQTMINEIVDRYAQRYKKTLTAK